MIRNGVLHTRILPKIRCDGIGLTCSIIFLRLLCIYRGAIPCGTAPRIPREGFLHAEYIVGVLGKLALAIATLQNKLRQRYRCKNPGILLILREKSTDFLHNIRFRQTLKAARLCAGLCCALRRLCLVCFFQSSLGIRAINTIHLKAVIRLELFKRRERMITKKAVHTCIPAGITAGNQHGLHGLYCIPGITKHKIACHCIR